jgi:hypothetical protein
MRGPEQIASVAAVLYIVFFALSPPAIVRTVLDNIVGMAVAVVGATYVTLYKSKVVGGLLLVALVLSMSRSGREGLTAGCTVSKANGYRYIGGDIPDSDPKVSSGTACGEACCANASCTKFTFIGGRCYLKTDAAYKGPVANTAGQIAEAGEVTRVASSTTTPPPTFTLPPLPPGLSLGQLPAGLSMSPPAAVAATPPTPPTAPLLPATPPPPTPPTAPLPPPTPPPTPPTTPPAVAPPPSPPAMTTGMPSDQTMQGTNSYVDGLSAMFQRLASSMTSPPPITPPVRAVETCSLEPYSNYPSTSGNFASF